MAISNMQQPQQIQGGLGSLQDPRQGYFLGKLVKKAKRAVKKVTKSPLGKLALLGGGAYLAGGMMGTGGGLMGGMQNFRNFRFVSFFLLPFGKTITKFIPSIILFTISESSSLKILYSFNH